MGVKLFYGDGGLFSFRSLTSFDGESRPRSRSYSGEVGFEGILQADEMSATRRNIIIKKLLLLILLDI